MPPSVLVLDADMIPSLAVARSLARHDVSVRLGCATSEAEKPVSAFSNACEELLFYPDPLGSTEAFVQWVERRLEEIPNELIIPVTERSQIALAHSHAIRAHRKRVILPPPEALEQVLDKDKTLALAESLEVPCPGRERVVDVKQLQELAGRFHYPVVLKPETSIAGDERVGLKQLSVRYAFDEHELLRLGADLLERTPFLLQEYVRGEGVGIEVIADRGTVCLAFQHRRLHELPLSGGGSSYRESVPLHARMLDAARRLIQALEWHGVAMVEFKHDPTNDRFWLMEINGRFWGSLPLSVSAGADFPWLLYRLYTEDALPDNLAQARTGIHCRKLSTDLMWYEHVVRGHYDSRLFQRPSNATLVRDALRIFAPDHRFDVQSLRDPRPGLVDIWRILRGQYRRIAETFHAGSQKRRLSAPAERKRLAGRLAQAQHVLFLCYGNINRSALAEVLFRQADAGRKRLIEIRSAGFHPVPGRPADPTMIEVAQARGIDLSDCRSIVVDAALLEWADIIFVMELRHRELIAEQFPRALEKTALLGSLAPVGGDPEIPDPYSEPAETYVACLERIQAAILELDSLMTAKARV